MAKHIKHASDETPADLSGASDADERIGLTEAFAPVSDSDGSHAGGARTTCRLISVSPAVCAGYSLL